MNAWNKFTHVLRQLDRLLDTPVPTLADSPGNDLVSEWSDRSADVLVIDASYSMDTTDYEPSRLHGAIQAASQFLRRRADTTPDALVGIITFSKRAEVISPLRPVSANMTETLAALESISTGSHTNIAAGLALAQERITSIPNVRQPRILLLTDGHPTTGEDLETVGERIKASGIQLDIIGIGGSPEDVNEPVLKAIASVIDGQTRYWFIKSIGELVQKFEALALREF